TDALEGVVSHMETIRPASPNFRLRQERTQRNLSQQKLADLLGTTQVTISRWEGGGQQPSAYFREKLCALFGKSTQDLGLIWVEPPSTTQQDALEAGSAQSPSTETAGLWTVPYLRNPHFTGREDVLEHLAQRLALQENKPDNMCQAVLTQPQAIKGLGGIGKTQLAVEYAYRHVLEYTAVFWIAAESVESILTSFHAIAELLQLPERQETDQQRIVAAVQRWLSSHGEWLLIWDNLEDVALLQRYLPPARSGAVLITTRCQALGGLAQNLELPTMTPEEGILLLLRRAKILTSQAAKEHMAHLAVIQSAQ